MAPKKEKIFITGGAGYLGRHLVEKYYKHNEITVFSRDEAKHYYLKKKFPKIKTVLGDVRNYERLSEAMKGHTIGIFTASLKQIESVDQHIEESLQTIVHGAINSRKAALANKLKAAVFISTDKSRSPTTLYGAMKFVAEQSFILNSESEKTRLSAVVYGNVINSTGSVIPLIWDSIKHGYSLKLYGEEMTRFMIDVDSAIECIEIALEHTGCTVVPHLKSFRIKDLFEIYKKKFGLKWELGVPRISEKYHEQMISPQETSRVRFNKAKKIYTIHYRDIFNEVNLSHKGFSSDDHLVTKKELEEILAAENYFQP